MASGELTSKQQTSEAIRQSETILITTSQRPTVDQVAAVLAMTLILRKFGKKVTAVISDSLPASVKFLDTSIIEKSLVGLRDFIIKVDVSNSEMESLRYEVEGKKLNIFLTPASGSLTSRDVSFDYGESDLDFDLAIVIGTGMRSKIDRIYTEFGKLFSEVPVVNIDFRRSNEGFGAINLIDPTAASLCEIIVALSESLQAGMVDANIATVLLTGLMGSTDKFTAPHTSAKSLTIAAQMMAAGGDQQKVVRGLSAVAPREERPREERPAARDERPAREDRPREDRPRDERPREDRPRDDRATRDERSTATAAPRGLKNERRIEPLSEPVIDRAKVEELVQTAENHDHPELPQPEHTVEPRVEAPVEPAVESVVEPLEQPVEQFDDVAEEVVPVFEPVAVADTLPANMQPEVFVEEIEPAFTPEPATVPGSVVTSEQIEVEKAPAEPVQMADFTAAAEILRRHHANIMPADAPAEDNERPAAH